MESVRSRCGLGDRGAAHQGGRGGGEEPRHLLVLDEGGQGDDELAERLGSTTRSSAERLSTATRFWGGTPRSPASCGSGGPRARASPGTRRAPAAAPPLHLRRSPPPARWRCGTAARGSPRRRTAGSARRARAAARNSSVSVLPVPVAPETRMIESRKKPPPHIRSSSSLPEVMRMSDERCLSSMAESGITMMPVLGDDREGELALLVVVPRNLRISMVRRRFSSSSTLRRMTTLSATNSSTPWRAMGRSRGCAPRSSPR
jgi:hypothetical protein